jgi:hypothetical protein
MNEYQVAIKYLLRKNRFNDPDGKFDRAGRCILPKKKSESAVHL